MVLSFIYSNNNYFDYSVKIVLLIINSLIFIFYGLFNNILNIDY